MITKVQALRYRSLRSLSVGLGPLQVLVGPNATGKTTFLDVIAFLGDLVSRGLEETWALRSSSFQDLLWQGEGTSFELAIEASIPALLREKIARPDDDTVRYEVEIGIDPSNPDLAPAILHEALLLFARGNSESAVTRSRFPHCSAPPTTLKAPAKTRKFRKVLGKTTGGSDKFYSEVVPESGKGWNPSIRFGPVRSALGNVPAEEDKFPVALWLRHLLTEGVQRVALSGELIRRPSPPNPPRAFRPDGANLPWVVHHLEERHPERLTAWIEHLTTALPDLESVRTILREEDRHRYLKLRYNTGLDAPSWMVSDGTLRLMALTLLAYVPDFQGVYLIEEPENGIHPRAVETMVQSLSSVYGGQILLATHSPVVLSNVQVNEVLCFAKTAQGETDVVRGDLHPQLADWHQDVSLDMLFASGVLG